MKPQINIGEVLTLEITAQNPHGEGIAKKDELIVFVKNAKKGEQCKVKITDIKRTFALGEKI
ncbi:TRAM domain-containing protein [Candidatus Micrarchaeota archaeon]|nr:TRAM domain-containing protein [Candidatus Micrarchaeota archaeon]